jgi:hypothetical protein
MARNGRSRSPKSRSWIERPCEAAPNQKLTRRPRPRAARAFQNDCSNPQSSQLKLDRRFGVRGTKTENSARANTAPCTQPRVLLGAGPCARMDQPTKRNETISHLHSPSNLRSTHTVYIKLTVIMVPSAPAHSRLRKANDIRIGTPHIAWIPRTEEQTTGHVEHALGKGVFGLRATEHGTQVTGY